MDIIDLIIEFTPRKEYILWGLAIIGTIFVIYRITAHLLYRKRLFIRTFSDMPGRRLGAILANQLVVQLRDIQSVHAETMLRCAREDITVLGNPRCSNEKLGNTIGIILIDKTPVGFLPSVVARIWPLFELEGEIFDRDTMITCNCRIKRGSKLIPSCYWTVKVDSHIEDPTWHIAKELAYRIALDTSRIREDAHIGTKIWQAFNAHTTALRLWQVDGFRLDNPEDVKRVDSKLRESIKYDPKYALAYYNLGVLTYLTFRNAQSNGQARIYFQKAAQLAEAARENPSEMEQKENRRIEGLALVGISRCYSQDHHRYGIESQEVVNSAREAAGKALILLDSDAHSLYAAAFAQHCTEVLEDIRRGRLFYETIIKKTKNKYPVVYNNLGYILMVGGEKLKAEGQEREAQDWWRNARRYMKKTIKLDCPRSRLTNFSYANLGNLHRLCCDYDRSIQAYRKALNGDPETSEYTEGLNELARVYFDMGSMQPALHYHDLSLHSIEWSVENCRELQKLMHQVVNVLREKNHPSAKGATLLCRQVSHAGRLPDLEAWLAELTRLLGY